MLHPGAPFMTVSSSWVGGVFDIPQPKAEESAFAVAVPEGAWGFIPTKNGPTRNGLQRLLKNSVLLKGTASAVP